MIFVIPPGSDWDQVGILTGIRLNTSEMGWIMNPSILLNIIVQIISEDPRIEKAQKVYPPVTSEIPGFQSLPNPRAIPEIWDLD